MSGIVNMTMREIDRISVIEALIAGAIKPQVAALRLGLSTRQIQRLAARYSAAGPTGLVSRQRGSASNRQLAPGVAQTALAIIRERYADFGPTFAAEKLWECHGLKLSKETVRRLMKVSGLWTTREQRRAPLHQPRTRRACLGELVQIDGSNHAWFEERNQACSLLVFVDDATGRLLQLHFAVTESTSSYFAAMHGYLAQHGKAHTFYADKAAVFRSPTARRSDSRTQFHRALAELNINLICANSPQAKGRVERMNRSLQDRLVKELRLHGISTIDDANRWSMQFIDAYNRRFAKVPRSTLDLHQPLHENENLDLILAWREERKLTSKLTLKFEDQVYVLRDTRLARAYIGQSVTVHRNAAGSVELRAGGIVLEYAIQPSASRSKAPVEVDSKTLDHALRELPHAKKIRARHYRNLTPKDIAQGVISAKVLTAKSASKATKSPSIQPKTSQKTGHF